MAMTSPYALIADVSDVDAKLVKLAVSAERLTEVDEFLDFVMNHDQLSKLNRTVRIRSENRFLREWNRWLFGGARRCFARMATCALEARIIYRGYSEYISGVLASARNECRSGDRYDWVLVLLRADSDQRSDIPARIVGDFDRVVEDKVTEWRQKGVVVLTREEALIIAQRFSQMLYGLDSLIDVVEALNEIAESVIGDMTTYGIPGVDNRLVRILAEVGLPDSLVAASGSVLDTRGTIEELLEDLPLMFE